MLLLLLLLSLNPVFEMKTFVLGGRAYARGGSLYRRTWSILYTYYWALYQNRINLAIVPSIYVGRTISNSLCVGARRLRLCLFVNIFFSKCVILAPKSSVQKRAEEERAREHFDETLGEILLEVYSKM